jgi:hypothetical protein
LHSAEEELYHLEKAIRDGQVVAELEEKPWPTTNDDKKRSALRAKVAEAEGALAVCREASQRQTENIERLQQQMKGERLAMFRAEIEAPLARYLRATSIDELADAAAKLWAMGGKYQLYELTFYDQLFPVIPVSGEPGAFDGVFAHLRQVDRFRRALAAGSLMAA